MSGTNTIPLNPHDDDERHSAKLQTFYAIIIILVIIKFIITVAAFTWCLRRREVKKEAAKGAGIEIENRGLAPMNRGGTEQAGVRGFEEQHGGACRGAGDLCGVVQPVQGGGNGGCLVQGGGSEINGKI